MGASGWDCVVPYQEDVTAALAFAHEKAFAENDYYWPEGVTRPSSIEAFWEDELAQETGAHSVLDLDSVAEESELGTVTPMPLDEVMALFGTVRPARADYDREVGELFAYVEERLQGLYLILYRDEQPCEIAFWGVSGD